MVLEKNDATEEHATGITADRVVLDALRFALTNRALKFLSLSQNKLPG